MKTKISIIIPTLGRETLYPLIENLLRQKVNFSYEIVLIPQVQLREERLKDERIRLYYEPLGKGFSYYRNVGIEKSKGKIIVFIDDDETPMNDRWLNNITTLIIEEKEKVVTAGVKIKLGQGYWTDCISLLGFPGGGAIGFRTMWKVDKNNYTEHLCSGNLAIKKEVIEKIGNFSNELKYGNEDVNLADRIVTARMKIKYIEEATVYHVARKELINFIKWNILRGKSAAEYLKNKKNTEKIGRRLASSKRILIKIAKENPKYLLSVLWMMFNQYLWQTGGYLKEKWRK